MFGVDFSETFTPVARLDTIKIFVGSYSSKKMENLSTRCEVIISK